MRGQHKQEWKEDSKSPLKHTTLNFLASIPKCQWLILWLNGNASFMTQATTLSPSYISILSMCLFTWREASLKLVPELSQQQEKTRKTLRNIQWQEKGDCLWKLVDWRNHGNTVAPKNIQARGIWQSSCRLTNWASVKWWALCSMFN